MYVCTYKTWKKKYNIILILNRNKRKKYSEIYIFKFINAYT